MILSELFKIAGKPVVPPDQDVEMSCADLDSGDSGRDESGVMHRQVVRFRVKTWSFTYTFLTEEEYRYMESLFDGLGEFEFTYPKPDGTAGTCTAYCSNTGIVVHNLRTGDYRNYKFKIIEC